MTDFNLTFKAISITVIIITAIPSIAISIGFSSKCNTTILNFFAWLISYWIFGVIITVIMLYNAFNSSAMRDWEKEDFIKCIGTPCFIFLIVMDIFGFILIFNGLKLCIINGNAIAIMILINMISSSVPVLMTTIIYMIDAI